MKYLSKYLIVGLLLVGLLGLAQLLTPGVASAVNVFEECQGTAASTAVCEAANTDSILGAGGLLNRVINILLIVVGLVSVIFIVIGGLRYVLSNGDGSNTKAAKDTILYALVGLVVALFAGAIVNFVLTRI